MLRDKTPEEHLAEAKEILYEKVRHFEDRTNTKRYIGTEQQNGEPVSKAALYNYALSLLNTEFYKMPKEARTDVLNQYK